MVLLALLNVTCHDSGLSKWIEIKGRDNPTSQLLPIISNKSCSGDGEGRKDTKEEVEKRVTKLCVCVKDGVVKDCV